MDKALLLDMNWMISLGYSFESMDMNWMSNPSYIDVETSTNPVVLCRGTSSWTHTVSGLHFLGKEHVLSHLW